MNAFEEWNVAIANKSNQDGISHIVLWKKAFFYLFIFRSIGRHLPFRGICILRLILVTFFLYYRTEGEVSLIQSQLKFTGFDFDKFFF